MDGWKTNLSSWDGNFSGPMVYIQCLIFLIEHPPVRTLVLPLPGVSPACLAVNANS